ncbi:MAG TPA: TonB-dependent receptor [Steroidobacteraceae bacterium]|nr:TonB-dependent receptor [Steroidobacteraceae bacterium]
MVRIRSLSVHTLLYLLYTAWLALLVITDAWAQDPVARFNLPSEPLPQALIDFYHQSGIEPGFASTPQIDNAKSNPVTGMMTSSAALALLLKGTGYTFRFDTDNSVDVIPEEPIGEQQQAVAAARSAAPPMAARPDGRDRGPLEQVNVTGSLIHGVQDAVAPLIYLKQQQLEMAGFPTVEDALYSLPMISLNGPREDLGIDNNFQYGAGLDLRGLGVGATLVLVNGYRQPLSGLDGDFVDVSTIPWSAVERIEVLPDGASALYGSDAVAGVVNIIMRDNFDGAETQVRYGAAIAGRRGLMVSQLLGTHWSGGHAMLAYEFSDTTPLDAADRPYAANANKAPYGGGNYDSYESDPGNILNPQTLQPEYGVPAGQNGMGLSAGVLSPSVNLQNQFARYQIFPEIRAHELYTAAVQDINDRVQVFFNGRFAERDALRSAFPAAQVLTVPPSNPFYVNPYAGTPYALVAYSFLQDFGPTIFAARTQVYTGTAGARLQFGKTWLLTASESYGRQSLRSDEYDQVNQAALAASLADPDPATAFDPFGAGSNTNPQTLNAIEADFPLHSVSTIESTRVVADGSLFALPAGDAKIALGLERREEALSHDIVDSLSVVAQTISQSYDRHVTALFSQLALPVIGNPANPLATPRLELVASGRYEHYSDFGRTFNPTVRLRWIPTESLKLRASWGRSFRAPKLDDLYDTSNNLAALIVLSDPKSPTGRSLVLVEQGSNPTLQEETAKTWTAGIDLAPAFLPDSTFSFTYYSIDYQNRIAQPAADDPFAILVNESEWAAVIARNPSQAQIAAICNSTDYIGSVSACLASSPAAIIDGRLANLAATRTTGIDVQAGDSFGGSWGRIDLGMTGNYVFKFDQDVTPTSPAVSIVDTISNPLALRLRGTIEWNREGPGMPGPGLGLAVNYTGGYRNPGSTLIPDVSPWTTLDARLVYRTGQDDGWLSGMEFSVNAVNVLNHDPPFVDDLNGYDVYNVQALGRVVSADIGKRW